jgi:flavin-dependent dehydrogenase
VRTRTQPESAPRGDRRPRRKQADFDVAILGGGLAGSLLARQLKRRLPALRLAVFERRADTDYKVGEATVELFCNYLVRKLGLSTYLYEHHLPKNGLRFFFDRPQKDAALEHMTEVGSQALPYHPSFQLDRKRLEADLRQMNAAMGVEVHEGVTVRDLELGNDGGRHAFMAVAASGERRCTSDWVVDASGRASLVAKLLKLRVPVDHAIAAAWARCTGVVDIDDLPLPGFGARVRYTSRRLSTVHFCYPGYWIWFIPLGRGVVSVGAVGDKSTPGFAARLRSLAGLLEFLDGHRAVRDLMRGATAIDFGAYGQLAYATTRFFSADRWGMTGEAAAFTDPFYSPGSDFIALENDYLCDLIERDRGGDAEGVRALAPLYDEYMQFRYRANLALYRHQYPLLGSSRLLRARWELDIANYYNLWVNAYMQDHHLDADRLRGELRTGGVVLATLERFGQEFASAGARALAAGTYFDGNLGGYSESLAAIDFVRDVGRPRSLAVVQRTSLAAFDRARREILAVSGRPAPAAGMPTLADYAAGRAFAAEPRGAGRRVREASP